MNAVDNQTLWRKLRVFCDADGHWKKVEQRETVNICSFVENAYDKNTALDKDKVSQLTFSVIFIPLFHFGPPVSFISFVSPVSLLSTVRTFSVFVFIFFYLSLSSIVRKDKLSALILS